jgi:Lysylphosphatidylglycerol synthase TM region
VETILAGERQGAAVFALMLNHLSLRRLARGLLLMAGAAALLGWLQRDASWSALRAQAAGMPSWVWLFAASGLIGTYGLRAARLRAEWASRELVPIADCLRIVFTHNVLLLVLPMRAGEAGYVWQVHRRWGVGLGEAAASLLWLRLQDAYVLALIATATLPPWPASSRVALALSLLLMSSALLPLLVRLGRRRWSRLDEVARLLLARRSDATGWVCSVANWSLKLGVISMMFAGLSGLDATSALRAAVGGELAGALPLQAPAGMGTYELGAGLAHAIGIGLSPQVVATALVVHAFAIGVTLLGAALAHTLLPGRSADRAIAT